MVTVVEDDVDIRRSCDVEWAMATRLDAMHGIIRIENVFGHGLNPSFPDYIGTKVGFDCCRPFPHTYEYDRASYKPITLEGLDLVAPEIRKASSPAVSKRPTRKTSTVASGANGKARLKSVKKGRAHSRDLASGGSAM